MIRTLSDQTPPVLIVPVGEFSDTKTLAKELAAVKGLEIARALESFNPSKNASWRLLSDEGEVFLVGLGARLDARTVYSVLRSFSHNNRKYLSAETGLFLSDAVAGKWTESEAQSGISSAGETQLLKNASTFAKEAACGIYAGMYKLDQRKSVASDHPLETLSIIIPEGGLTALNHSALKSAVENGRIMAESQQLVMHLINIPSNWKTPEQFAKIAADTARKHSFTCKIFDENRLQREKFDLLLAVNRGSEYPARFVILEYEGRTKSKAASVPHIALAGKGVTYDSGGLSIKPSESMVWMKCDMAGAATVLAVTQAAARLRLPVKLTTVIPLTDNLVDARSIKPGDIVGSHSGKTVEIIDTDAEGRLILADALSWLCKTAKPDHIIDVATLTGSAVRTFGNHCSAMFSNNLVLQQTLTSSGDLSGERVWPLPLWSEYNDEILSDVADLRNLSGKPTAGTISAAKFLEAFIDDHPSWAHLDVAGVVFGDTEFGKRKNATGYGVRLLVEVLSQLAGTSEG